MPIIDEISKDRIALQQLIPPIDRLSNKGHKIAFNLIRAQHPRSADARKDVNVTNPEHHFRLAVDQPRPRLDRILERIPESFRRRFFRGRKYLIPIGLTHAARDRIDMILGRWDNDDPTGQRSHPA